MKHNVRLNGVFVKLEYLKSFDKIRFYQKRFIQEKVFWNYGKTKIFSFLWDLEELAFLIKSLLKNPPIIFFFFKDIPVLPFCSAKEILE